VDYEGAIFLWRVDKRDFTLWTITSTTTLFFGIEIGVLIGVSMLILTQLYFCSWSYLFEIKRSDDVESSITTYMNCATLLKDSQSCNAWNFSGWFFTCICYTRVCKPSYRWDKFLFNLLVLFLRNGFHSYPWSHTITYVLAAVLGRLPGTTVYRNMKQYPEAYTYNGIVIVRIDAPIYFANISYIKDRWNWHLVPDLLSVMIHIKNQHNNTMFRNCRLREYEVAIDKHTSKGPDMERIYFVILEMSRKSNVSSIHSSKLTEVINLIDNGWDVTQLSHTSTRAL